MIKIVYLDYLTSEKLLGLSAGLIAATSIVAGLFFFVFLPQFRPFALAMVVLGLLEGAVFIPNYLRADGTIAEKIALFESGGANRSAEMKAHALKMLRVFFLAKLLYAAVFFAGVVSLSRFDLNPALAGVLTALVLHAGFAATIDNFGERHTRKFSRALDLEAAPERGP